MYNLRKIDLKVSVLLYKRPCNLLQILLITLMLSIKNKYDMAMYVSSFLKKKELLGYFGYNPFKNYLTLQSYLYRYN